jgi:hypothetical protein
MIEGFRTRHYQHIFHLKVIKSVSTDLQCSDGRQHNNEEFVRNLPTLSQSCGSKNITFLDKIIQLWRKFLIFISYTWWWSIGSKHAPSEYTEYNKNNKNWASVIRLRSLFLRNKNKFMRSPFPLSVCVSPTLTIKHLNQSLLTLVCISWYLNPYSHCSS